MLTCELGTGKLELWIWIGRFVLSPPLFGCQLSVSIMSVSEKQDKLQLVSELKSSTPWHPY